MVFIVVMLENGPPSPFPPPPFKISLITKLSGSIIHYVQQHYTINIQKPLVIGRTIVSQKKTKEKEKKHTRKQQMYQEPDARLFFFFLLLLFFNTKMHREFCEISPKNLLRAEHVALLHLCVCLCACVRLHVYVYIKTIHDQSVRRVLSQHVSAVAW